MVIAPDVRVREAAPDDLAWLADCAIAMAWETERKTARCRHRARRHRRGADRSVKARYFVAMRDARDARNVGRSAR